MPIEYEETESGLEVSKTDEGNEGGAEGEKIKQQELWEDIFEYKDKPSNSYNGKFHEYTQNLISSPEHILNFLYQEKNDKKGSNANYTVPMDAGHMLSKNTAKNEEDPRNILALESRSLNRGDSHVEKTMGLEKQTVLLEAIPVEQLTAEQFEQKGEIAPGTVENAPKGRAWNVNEGVTAYKEKHKEDKNQPDTDMFPYANNNLEVRKTLGTKVEERRAIRESKKHGK